MKVCPLIHYGDPGKTDMLLWLDLSTSLSSEEGANRIQRLLYILRTFKGLRSWAIRCEMRVDPCWKHDGSMLHVQMACLATYYIEKTGGNNTRSLPSSHTYKRRTRKITVSTIIIQLNPFFQPHPRAHPLCSKRSELTYFPWGLGRDVRSSPHGVSLHVESVSGKRGKRIDATVDIG